MKNILYLFSVVIIAISCSSSNEGAAEKKRSGLEGVWELTGVEVSDTAEGELRAAKIIADILIDGGCDLFTFTFNEDGTLQTESKLSHVVISFAPECPTDIDVESATWVLEGDQLTTTDSNDEVNTITIQLDGNMLTVNGEDIDDDYLGSQVIFTRK